MRHNRRAHLVEGDVGKTIFRLTIPMVFGLVGIVGFHLVDTYFVSRLGTKELAAMSFTFPVVMVLSGLALGLGAGASAVISRTIGEEDREQIQRLTTDSLFLAVTIVTALVLIGFLTMRPVFRYMGAPPELMPLIVSYMRIWYPGMVCVVVPMMGRLSNLVMSSGVRRLRSALARKNAKKPPAAKLAKTTAAVSFSRLLGNRILEALYATETRAGRLLSISMCLIRSLTVS